MTKQVIATGLNRPWDTSFTPDGTLLYTERNKGTINALMPDGEKRVLYTAPDNGAAEAFTEAGMMGLTADTPESFPTTRYVLACMTSTAPEGNLPGTCE